MRQVWTLLGAVLVLAAASGATAPPGLGSALSGATASDRGRPTDRGRPIHIGAREVTTLHAAVTRTRPPTRAVDDDYENTLKVGLAPGCTRVAGCPPQFVKEAQMSLRSPGLTGPPFVVNATGDPQIAAGRSFVVVTLYNRIWVYGKSGKLATADADGKPLTYPISAEQLFASPLEDVNKNLNLPSFLSCDPKNPHANGSYCVADIYDTRVVYDDFRDRFWLFSTGRNWRNPGVAFDTKEKRTGLRNPGFLAVSKSGDPRGGWYLYMFWQGIDLADHSDYPSLGISKDFFVQTINSVSEKTDPFHWYTLVNVFDADKLASGGCSTPCGFSYWDIKHPGTSTIVRSTIQPAVQHDVPPGGWTLMTEVASPNKLWVYGFRKSEGAINPPLHMAAVTVKPWVGALNPPQPGDSTVPKPRPMLFGNVNGSAMKAAERDGRLAVTWLDCVDWAKTRTCASSIRLAEVDANAALTGASSAPLIDRTFGFHNDLDEGKDEVVGYGNPGVELNAAGDRVVVYNRVGGKAVYPEARYSVWLHGESDVRPSAALMKGAHPCGPSMTNATDTDPVCNLDVAGIAVDPFDDQAVWLAHSFVDTDRALRTAVGKVFGRTLPDFQCWFGQPSLSYNGNGFTARIVVANTGDASGKLVKVKLAVGKQLVSSTVAPLTLGPGDTKVVELPGQGPGSGSFDLSVALSAPAVEQYNIANDACEHHVAVRETGAGTVKHATSLLVGANGKPPTSSLVRQAFLGWGQGASFGSPFQVLFASLAPIPMIHLGPYALGGKKEAVTPASIAAGAGDAYLVALNQAISQWGKAIYVRPLAEMNNGGNVWSAYLANGRSRGAAYSTASYRRAFARIALVVHGGPNVNAKLRALGMPPVRGDLAANPFPRVRVMWSPLAGGNPQVPGNAPSQYWPDDAYVDVAGGDIYDERGSSPPWAKLEELYRFAVARGKPFAVPEWGIYGFDDPQFVWRMCEFLSRHRTETAVYFNGSHGSIFDLASKPKSVAAYRSCIGALAGPLPPWAVVAEARVVQLELAPRPSSGPRPLQATFSLTAKLSVPVAHWLVAFGDGSEQEGSGSPPKSLSHTYAADGTYVATLVVWHTPPFTDGAIRFLTTAKTSVGSGSPVALAVERAPATGKAPLKVVFTLTTTSTKVKSWRLLYGDGLESGKKNGPLVHFAGHTYTKTGSYRVILVAYTPAGRVYAVTSVSVA